VLSLFPLLFFSALRQKDARYAALQLLAVPLLLLHAAWYVRALAHAPRIGLCCVLQPKSGRETER
jgi:hypothetical protein